MRADRIADRYAGRNGERLDMTPKEKHDQHVRDVVDVASFLLWHETSDMYGGVKAPKAFEAFARLVNMPAWRLRKIVRGPDG